MNEVCNLLWNPFVLVYHLRTLMAYPRHPQLLRCTLVCRRLFRVCLGRLTINENIQDTAEGFGSTPKQLVTDNKCTEVF